MSDVSAADDQMSHVQPTLAAGLQRQRNAAGELILITAKNDSYLTVGDDEAGVLDLIDGQRSLQTVVRDAIQLPTPMRPMATLSLLRRLHSAGMVGGLEGAGDLFTVPKRSIFATVGRVVRGLATIKIPIPLLGLPLSVGRFIPRSVWPTLSKAAIALFVVAALSTIVTGHLFNLLDPFLGDHVVDRTVGLYISASLLLSLRDGLRGLAFTSMGLPAPRATISILCGVVHLGIDDRQRRAASASERETFAWAGIAALCLLSALSGLAWLIEGNDNTWLRALASTSLYLVVFNAAPFGRGDAWHLIGIRTRIPDVTQRAAVFLFKRSVKNLMRNEPIRRAEETYLTMAIAWLAHWILSLWLVTGHLLPGALNALQSLMRTHTRASEPDHFSGAVAVLIAGLLMGTIGLLALGLLAVIASAVMQMLKPERSTPPQSSERIGDGADALVDEMQRVPFLATLPRDELSGLIAGMRREKYGSGAIVVRQGEQGDRFCFLHAGRCAVEFEEESGMVHTVATLKEGDFFGEIALLDEVPRTATVRTLEATEVYSLDRETFVALVERSAFAREAVLDQVRNAAFLRTVPVFQTLSAKLMSTLLSSVEVVRETSGTSVVHEGDRGDAMYVIREGACDVFRDKDGTEDHLSTLSSGDWFGEIALLRGIKRTATVRTNSDAVLVKVPGGVLDDVLLADFQIGIALERAMAQRLVALEMQ